MASVYLAHDPEFDREAAVKVLPAQLANNQRFFDRFRREARTIAGLEYAAIVPVYDFGQHSGRPRDHSHISGIRRYLGNASLYES
jgi:serine/threonine-protein kinase